MMVLTLTVNYAEYLTGGGIKAQTGSAEGAGGETVLNECKFFHLNVSFNNFMEK